MNTDERGVRAWAWLGQRSAEAEPGSGRAVTAMLDALSALRGEIVVRWRGTRRRRGDLYRTYESWRILRIHESVSAVEDVLATVAANVRRLRHERALTQDALAERASMDPSEVRRIESGRREPGVRVLARLARGLEVHPGEFFAAPGQPWPQ